MADSTARWEGVSNPPDRWHTGPGKVAPDQPIWYVMPTHWPHYVVCAGRYLERLRGDPTLARVKTSRRVMEVAIARIFVLRSEAQREAEILGEFAARNQPAPHQTKLIPKRSRS